MKHNCNIMYQVLQLHIYIMSNFALVSVTGQIIENALRISHPQKSVKNNK